jgi:hypothetical protein
MIDIIIRELPFFDLTLGSLLHDGVLVYSSARAFGVGLVDYPLICKHMEISIARETGYHTVIKHKSYTPLASDTVPYTPRLAPIGSTVTLGDRYVNTPKFKDGERCICIKAGMGSGKTFAMLDFFRTQFTHKQRALLVTGRINQADSLEGLFTRFDEDGNRTSTLIDAGGHTINIYLYNNSEDSPTLRTNQPGIYIIQWESLHKLRDNTNSYHGFHFLFIDEVRTILNQSCSVVTNKSNLRINMNLFRDICSKTQTIMMDADLLIDSTVKSLVFKEFGGFWEKHEVRVESYTTQSMPREIVLEPSDTRWLNELIESVKSSRRLREAGAKSPTFVSVRSKRVMHEILFAVTGATRPDFLSSGVAYFSSESSSNVMSAWKDINGFIRDNDVDLIITTSKVTVCADIQEPMRKCFVHAASSGGCHARDLFQTMGRARNLQDRQIVVLIKAGPPPPTDILSLSEFKKNVRIAGRDKYDFIEWIDSESGWVPDANMFNRLRVEESPEWMLNLACAYQLEIEENSGPHFIPTFLRVARYKGWPCRRQHEVEDSDLDMKEIRDDSKDEMDAYAQDILNKINELEPEEVNIVADRRTDDGSEKLGIQMARCVACFPSLRGVFELDWFRYFERNKQVFERAYLLSKPQISLQTHDAMRIMQQTRAGFVELAQMWTPAFNILKHVLRSLSIDEEDFHFAEEQGSSGREVDDYPIDISSLIGNWRALQTSHELYEQAMNRNVAKKRKEFTDINRGMVSHLNSMFSDWGRVLEPFKNKGRGANRDKRTYRIALNTNFAYTIGAYVPRREHTTPSSLKEVAVTVRDVHFRHAADSIVSVFDPKKRATAKTRLKTNKKQRK